MRTHRYEDDTLKFITCMLTIKINIIKEFMGPEKCLKQTNKQQRSGYDALGCGSVECLYSMNKAVGLTPNMIKKAISDIIIEKSSSFLVLLTQALPSQLNLFGNSLTDMPGPKFSQIDNED